MTYLNRVPDETGKLSVTRGANTPFWFEQFDDESDEPVPFAEGQSAHMLVGKARVRVDAVIDGARASFSVPVDVSDLLRTGEAWQVILDDDKKALFCGCFVRHDGGGACSS